MSFLRIDGGPGGQTYGVWECDVCGEQVESDHTTYGLDCPECGATIVEGSR